jgi:hypothetical protein
MNVARPEPHHGTTMSTTDPIDGRASPTDLADPRLPALLDRLTLEEKVRLLTGRDLLSTDGLHVEPGAYTLRIGTSLAELPEQVTLVVDRPTWGHRL